MSACISGEGEYSDHVPDATHTCTRCGVLDEDAVAAELLALREATAAWVVIREGHGHDAQVYGLVTTLDGALCLASREAGQALVWSKDEDGVWAAFPDSCHTLDTITARRLQIVVADGTTYKVTSR